MSRREDRFERFKSDMHAALAEDQEDPIVPATWIRVKSVNCSGRDTIANNCFADALCNFTGGDPAALRALLELRDGEQFDLNAAWQSKVIRDLMADFQVTLHVYVSGRDDEVRSTGRGLYVAPAPVFSGHVINGGQARVVRILLTGTMSLLRDADGDIVRDENGRLTTHKVLEHGHYTRLVDV